MAKPAILVNLNRCTGCWTCSMACKVAYKLDVDEWRQYIRNIGGNGIDEPAGTWPNLNLGWMPIYTNDCVLCGSRLAEGLEPYCTYNCPTKALPFGYLDDPQSPLNERLMELEEKGFNTFTLPKWEQTRPEILYIER